MENTPISCRQIMRDHVIRVQVDQPLLTAIIMMNQRRVSSVIAEENGQPIGVITERDIVQFAETERRASEVRVREVMSGSPVTVKEETGVEDAIKSMLEHNVRRLPVVRDGRIVGIVTSTDILTATAKGLLNRDVIIYLSDIFRKDEPSKQISNPTSSGKAGLTHQDT